MNLSFSQHLISTKLLKQDAISILPFKLCTVQRFYKEESSINDITLIHLLKWITIVTITHTLMEMTAYFISSNEAKGITRQLCQRGRATQTLVLICCYC